MFGFFLGMLLGVYIDQEFALPVIRTYIKRFAPQRPKKPLGTQTPESEQ